MQRITPCLWFDGDAEDAARFYASIFKSSRITGVTTCGEGMPRPAGSVLTVTFELDGQELIALNGGPQFPFTEAISLSVACESQDELDEYWARLSEGGSEARCGWLKDRYGVSWQVVPVQLQAMLRSPDLEKKQRMMEALMRMVKLDLAGLQRAFEGR